MSTTIRRFKTGLATLAFATLPLGSALAAPVFSLSGPSEVVAGNSVVLTLNAVDVVDLAAFQFDVLFDPAVFSATDATEGSFLATVGSTFFGGGTINNTLGKISAVFNTLIGGGPGGNGTGVLATLSFLAIGPASSFGAFSLGTATVLDSQGIDIAIVAMSHSVEVTPVPEPATWPLIIAGIGVVGELARRRTRTAPLGSAA